MIQNIPRHILFEGQTKLETPSVYHYVFDDDALSMILKDGGLKPADVTRRPKAMKEYGSRHSSGDPDKYFKTMYDRHYKTIMGKPYKHYGIYLTTVDLSHVLKKVKYRIDIPINSFDHDNTVIDIHKKTYKFSVALLKKIRDEYSDPVLVKKLYDKGKYIFTYLPQVVCFDDMIPVTKKQVVKIQ